MSYERPSPIELELTALHSPMDFEWTEKHSPMDFEWTVALPSSSMDFERTVQYTPMDFEWTIPVPSLLMDFEWTAQHSPMDLEWGMPSSTRDRDIDCAAPISPMDFDWLLSPTDFNGTTGFDPSSSKNTYTPSNQSAPSQSPPTSLPELYFSDSSSPPPSSISTPPSRLSPFSQSSNPISPPTRKSKVPLETHPRAPNGQDIGRKVTTNAIPDKKPGRRDGEKKTKGKKPASKTDMPHGKLPPAQNIKIPIAKEYDRSRGHKGMRKGAGAASAKKIDKNTWTVHPVLISKGQNPRSGGDRVVIVQEELFQWDDGPT